MKKLKETEVDILDSKHFRLALKIRRSTAVKVVLIYTILTLKMSSRMITPQYGLGKNASVSGSQYSNSNF